MPCPVPEDRLNTSPDSSSEYTCHEKSYRLGKMNILRYISFKQRI
jgi:hypothetical protein